MLSCMFGWQQFFAAHRRSSGAASKLRFMIHWILLVVLCAPTVVSAQAADLEQGKQLFESLCGSCHGPLGNGGRGANLAQPRLRHATERAQVPRAFITASLAAKRAASSGTRPRQNATSAGVKQRCRKRCGCSMHVRL